MLYYKLTVKIFKFLRQKEKKRNIVDFYQDSIEKVGRDQIQKLVDKGLNIPVFVL